MGRKRKQNRSKGIQTFLLMAFALVTAAILWLGLPFLADKDFGAASNSLTQFQRWTYSLRVEIAKSRLLTPTCKNASTVNFTIDQGSSVNRIVNNLEQQNLVSDSAALRVYLIYRGLDTRIRAGTYQLNCAMTAVEIANAIKNIYQDTVVFDILPGWRAEEIAAALPSSGIDVSPVAFLGVVRYPSGLNLPPYLPAGSSVEGLLYPGEYTISRSATAQELVQTFVDRFVQVVPESLLDQVQANGITTYQAIILASIVQRETFATGERPLMASVFYNRLAKGMRLETDPTVQYALGYDAAWGWWKSPLNAEDLKVDSPYNTYLVSGLPPAPIANPELSSIEAAVNPEKSNYLYFRAKCDGSGFHVFAVTYEEHVANACP